MSRRLASPCKQTSEAVINLGHAKVGLAAEGPAKVADAVPSFFEELHDRKYVIVRLVK